MSVTVHLLENFYRDPLDPSEARIACGQEQGAEDWNADPEFVTCPECLALIERDRDAYAKDFADYYIAMMNNNLELALRIERRHGLEGEPPEVVTAFLKAKRAGRPPIRPQTEQRGAECRAVCVDLRHDDPCPLPCLACEDECDPRFRSTWAAWERALELDTWLADLESQGQARVIRVKSPEVAARLLEAYCRIAAVADRQSALEAIEDVALHPRFALGEAAAG